MTDEKRVPDKWNDCAAFKECYLDGVAAGAQAELERLIGSNQRLQDRVDKLIDQRNAERERMRAVCEQAHAIRCHCDILAGEPVRDARCVELAARLRAAGKEGGMKELVEQIWNAPADKLLHSAVIVLVIYAIAQVAVLLLGWWLVNRWTR